MADIGVGAGAATGAVLLSEDGLAGTGGGFFGEDEEGRRGVGVKSGSLGVGVWMCSGMKLK